MILVSNHFGGVLYTFSKKKFLKKLAKHQGGFFCDRDCRLMTFIHGKMSVSNHRFSIVSSLAGITVYCNWFNTGINKTIVVQNGKNILLSCCIFSLAFTYTISPHCILTRAINGVPYSYYMLLQLVERCEDGRGGYNSWIANPLPNRCVRKESDGKSTQN